MVKRQFTEEETQMYIKKKKKKKKLNAVDDQRDANGNHQAVLLPIDWQKCRWLITPRDCEEVEKPEKLDRADGNIHWNSVFGNNSTLFNKD